MEATPTIEARRQRLIEKAGRRNMKSKRLQKKIQREVQRKSPNMARISKWQNKSAKHVNKGLRYLDRMNALGLGEDQNDQETEVSFKLEKVCLC